MLKSAIRRWRERRRERRARALEKEVTAREALRDFNASADPYNTYGSPGP